ncbi:MAG: RIP metalloprotease RseP [Pyrinomonadaceae bacterium]|nr:RIP metalloprotease RseP [Acidobacteriota bacterium]MBK7932209.1 RIP metalloprotease RseP [Acidobacteriota bacterium]MBP7376259.1 RIP metalloprotease RseP [Pyrinomonadaceae bacterium]
MESILSTAFYYVIIPLLVLGIAINIHEFGHFIIAKMFGMRVEAFSFFGLGPRVWGFKVGHTDYRISAIPLGAFVKLYGDDATGPLEGKDDETIEKVPESELYELRPRWQKFFVMLGGPFMNIVLALSIPFGMAMIQGIPAVPAPVIASVRADGAGAKAGLQVGDRIVSFNGVENPTWRNITVEAGINPDRTLDMVVERNSQRVPLQITPRKEEVFAGQNAGLIDAEADQGVVPVMVGEVAPNTPAAEAGLQLGDRIVSVNGEQAKNIQQTKTTVDKNKALPIQLVVERGGQYLTLNTQVRKLDDGTERLGFGFQRPDLPLEKASIGSAIEFAYTSNWENLKATGAVLGQVFSGNRSVKDSGIGGPVGIIQQSAEATRLMGIEGFFLILTAISLSLGIFNLLPVPMLDGGQIMVLGIDKIMSWFGRTLSMVARERIQLTGLAVILLLMVFVFFLDFSRIAARFGGSTDKPAVEQTK